MIMLTLTPCTVMYAVYVVTVSQWWSCVREGCHRLGTGRAMFGRLTMNIFVDLCTQTLLPSLSTTDLWIGLFLHGVFFIPVVVGWIACIQYNQSVESTPGTDKACYCVVTVYYTKYVQVKKNTKIWPLLIVEVVFFNPLTPSGATWVQL